MSHLCIMYFTNGKAIIKCIGNIFGHWQINSYLPTFSHIFKSWCKRSRTIITRVAGVGLERGYQPLGTSVRDTPILIVGFYSTNRDMKNVIYARKQSFFLECACMVINIPVLVGCASVHASILHMLNNLSNMACQVTYLQLSRVCREITLQPSLYRTYSNWCHCVCSVCVIILHIAGQQDVPQMQYLQSLDGWQVCKLKTDNKRIKWQLTATPLAYTHVCNYVQGGKAP